MHMPRVSAQQLLNGLRAAGEATRLRILVLLARAEFNVKDLTQILGQSQPRVSRHLKLLTEAGLVERFHEGSWAFFRLSDAGAEAGLIRALIELADPGDPVLARDWARAEAIREERQRAAQDYFRRHAAEWDSIRALHVAEADVEAAMRDVLGPGPFDLIIDLGTGTGRCLELFAPICRRGLGIDLNKDMLSYARARLDRPDLRHLQVRHGDLFNLPVDDAAADVVVLHQVLHYLDDPAKAIAEAARILKPEGKLLIADFAPHDLEFLRDSHAHSRLGFEDAQMRDWLLRHGLGVGSYRTLTPARGESGQKLTVAMWLAIKRNAAAGMSGTQREAA
jgi:ubiquinone/menaquinone biosynthesis C-methylase UbiE